MADKVRPIDAGELIGYLHEKTFVDGDDRSMVYKAIEEQPTIEAEPVKHGWWIDNGGNMWLCSYCKENLIYSETKIDRAEKQRYCSRCGARMDRGDE